MNIEANPVSSEAKSAGSEGVLFGFTFAQTLFVVLWPLVVAACLLLFGLATKSDVSMVADGVRARAPVKVFNVTDRIRAGSSNGQTPDQVMDGIDAEVKRFVDAGYVVIDERTILGAPTSTKAEVRK